jgi:hypothetical protein
LLLAVEPAAQELGGTVDSMLTGVVEGIERMLLNAASMLSDLLGDGGGGLAEVLCDLSKRVGSVQFHFDLDPVFQGQVWVLTHDKILLEGGPPEHGSSLAIV